MVPIIGLLATAALAHGGPVQSGHVSETSDTIVVSGNDRTESFEARGRVVLIQGNGSRVTIRGGAKRVEINGNDHVVTIDGTPTLLMGGNSNRLTARGAVARLKVSGTDNRVTVDRLTLASVAGVGNIVLWKKGPNGRKPRTSVQGVDNRVSRG